MTAGACRNYALKYQLGDWTVFTATLPLQLASVKAAERRNPVSRPEPPAVPLAPGSEGFMMRALPVAEALSPIGAAGDYLRYVQLQYRHSVIDFGSSFEDYQKKFSSKTRSTIKRKVRKFAEHSGGALSWRTYRTVDELREFLPLARRVARTTYQERLFASGIPESEAFVRGMESLAAQDHVRAYLLFDRERPVSYLYCPVDDGTLIYSYLGYDPDYMRFSVGTVLQWLAVEQMFSENRFSYFDFTEGESDHKRLFATHETLCANVLFLKNTLKNRILAHSHWQTGRFSGWLGDTLDRFGIRAKVKRFLRFRHKSSVGARSEAAIIAR
jgi:CelD/BcsL family acetyltransferase involved in cellulose biosynthesis